MMAEWEIPGDADAEPLEAKLDGAAGHLFWLF
jgi:hypothetical protein